MEIRNLRCFVTVAEAGTVTAAAGLLDIGQPAVSRQIQQLERELGLQLFAREDGRLRLTAAGRDLLGIAREAVRSSDAVLRTAAEIAAGRLEEIRIVSTATTRDDVLARWVATWEQTAPLPSLDEALGDEIYDRLRDGADLAVSPLTPPSGLDSLVVADLPLWAHVAPGHAWASRGHVGLHELLTQPLLLLNRSFQARRILDRAMDDADIAPDGFTEFRSGVAAQAVAASGRGVCVVTDDPHFGLVALPVHDAADRPLQVRLHAAWDPAHHGAHAIRRLAVELSAFVHTIYPPVKASRA